MPASPTVFTGTTYNSLKLTLGDIVDDTEDGVEAKAQYSKWMDVKSMKDHWEEDLEMGGPPTISEKPEGTAIKAVGLTEGFITRYTSRTFAGVIVATEEAMEDQKYPKVVNAGYRLKRAAWKTVDIDATTILQRMFNTSYLYGDGACLCSASHTLPNGGTYSNVMATAMAPSTLAVQVAVTAISKLPDHAGVTQGYEPVRILSPVDQRFTWKQILGSDIEPAAGNFSAINVVKTELDLEYVALKFWNNTTSNWAIQTDAANGINFRWRARFKSRDWVENDQTAMKWSIRGRWAKGCSEFRSIFGVNA